MVAGSDPLRDALRFLPLRGKLDPQINNAHRQPLPQNPSRTSHLIDRQVAPPATADSQVPRKDHPDRVHPLRLRQDPAVASQKQRKHSGQLQVGWKVHSKGADIPQREFIAGDEGGRRHCLPEAGLHALQDDQLHHEGHALWWSLLVKFID